MNKLKIVLIVAGIAALAGGGTAIAAKGHTTTQRSVTPMVFAGGMHDGPRGLDAAATYLGTTTSALLTQLQSGKTLAQIADATSGKSAQGLIDALVADAKAKLGANAPADLTQHITDMVNGVHGMRGPGGMGGMGGMHGGMHGGLLGLDAAATYLGTTVDALRTQLQSGKTLAQIANATPNKSAQGLIDAMTADAKAHITTFVNGG